MRAVALALVFSALTSCSAQGSPPQQTATSKSEATPNETLRCSANPSDKIALRAPDGTLLDLTGTWQLSGGGPLTFVSQFGRCVFFAGGFPQSAGGAKLFGSPYGARTTVFAGTIGLDFVVSGQWADVRRSQQVAGINTGRIQYKIVFGSKGAIDLQSIYAGDPDQGASQTLHKIADGFLEPSW